MRSPHRVACKSRGIEVLFMTDTIDSFMMNALFTFEGKKFRNGADANLDLPEPKDKPEERETLPPQELEGLIERFKKVLGERVSEVRESKVLTDSPARL